MYARQDEVNRPLTITETLNCRMALLAKKISIQPIDMCTLRSTQKTILGFGPIHCSCKMITPRVQ